MRKRRSLAARKAKQVAKTTIGGVLGTAFGIVMLPIELVSRAESGQVHDEPYMVEAGLSNLFEGAIETLFDWED